jgi:hypothetical protein
VIYILVNAWLSRQPWLDRCGVVAGRAAGVQMLAPQGDGTAFVPSKKYAGVFTGGCFLTAIVAFGIALSNIRGATLGIVLVFTVMYAPFLAYPVWSQRVDFRRWLASR